MPLSTAAKAALCLCPPAVMAGTAATVPSVKRAVHHLTAEHRPHRPVHRLATAAVHPPAEPGLRAGCNPIVAGVQPAVPLVTYAAPIPPEPAAVRDAIGGPAGGGIGGAPGIVGGVPAFAAVAPVSPVTGTPAQVTPPPTGVGSVPEPASWMMLILGAGAVGGALRRRRLSRRVAVRTTTGATLWSAGTVAVEAGDVATTVAVKSAVASAAGKALMCVCPAAVVAGSVMAVPPLRHAVHASTAVPRRAAGAGGRAGGAVRPSDYGPGVGDRDQRFPRRRHHDTALVLTLVAGRARASDSVGWHGRSRCVIKALGTPLCDSLGQRRLSVWLYR